MSLTPRLGCLILRGVSDLVDSGGGEAYEDFDVFVAGAKDILTRLVDSLPVWIARIRKERMMVKVNNIRKLSETDFDAFVEIATNAYPGMTGASEEDKQKLKQRLLKAYDEDPTVSFYGLFRDGQLLGGMRLHDFIMNVLSVKVEAGGIGSVAVDLLHKKEKVARDMVAYFLKHYRENGVCLTLLYPFRPDFYKRMGFGYGTKKSQYRVKPASLPRGATKAHIRFLQRADRRALMDCYLRYVNRTHGMIEKSEFELDRVFETPDNRVVGYWDSGKIWGYMVFTFKRGHQENVLVNDILVEEFVYETREALAELLTFLHTQFDQINHIILNVQDEHFHYLLLDPRNGSDNLIPRGYHESNTQGVGIMYRVIDTRGIFRVLSDHNFGGQNCVLKLSVGDSFLAQNAGSVVVHFENGAPRLKGDDSYEAEISLDISDFSSLLMGAVNFRSLYRYGLADISDTQYLDTVNKIFMTEEKPVCMTHF